MESGIKHIWSWPTKKVPGIRRDLSYSVQFQFKSSFVDLKARFPYYQGESTIFDEVNFLSQTPDTKNIYKV